MIMLVFAVSLAQEPVVSREQAVKHLLEVWKQKHPGAGEGLPVKIKLNPVQPVCSAVRIYPVDPAIDPKMGVAPKQVPEMPLYAGQPPCENKLP